MNKEGLVVRNFRDKVSMRQYSKFVDTLAKVYGCDYSSWGGQFWGPSVMCVSWASPEYSVDDALNNWSEIVSSPTELWQDIWDNSRLVLTLFSDKGYGGVRLDSCVLIYDEALPRDIRMRLLDESGIITENFFRNMKKTDFSLIRNDRVSGMVERVVGYEIDWR